jgi:YggT family protein
MNGYIGATSGPFGACAAKRRQAVLALGTAHRYLRPDTTTGRTMDTLASILYMVLSILYFVILVQVIMSWLVNFQVLNLRQPLVAQVWYGLSRALEPLYSRVRRYIPATSGIDFASLIVLVVVIALRIALKNNFNIEY